MDKPHRQYEQVSQKNDQPKSPANLKDLSGRATSHTEMPAKTFTPLKTLRYEVMQLQQRTQEVQEAPKKYPDSERSLDHRNALFKVLEQAPIGQELLKKIEGMHINIAVADLPSAMPMIESPNTIILSDQLSSEQNALRLAEAVYHLEALKENRSPEPYVGLLPLHPTPELSVSYLTLMQAERINATLAEIELANALNIKGHQLTNIFNDARQKAEDKYTRETEHLGLPIDIMKKNAALLGEEAGREQIKQEFQKDRVVLPGISSLITYGQWDTIVWMRAHRLYNPEKHLVYDAHISMNVRVHQHAFDALRLNKFEVTREDYIKNQTVRLATSPGERHNFALAEKAFIDTFPASEQNVLPPLDVHMAATAALQEAYLSGALKPTFGPLADKSYTEIFRAMFTEEQQVLRQSLHQLVLTADEIAWHNQRMREVYQSLVTGSEQGGTICRETLTILDTNRIYILREVGRIQAGVNMGSPYHSALIEANRRQEGTLQAIVHEVRGHEFLSRSDLSVFPYGELYNREVLLSLMIHEEMYCYILESEVATETNELIITPMSKGYHNILTEKGEQTAMEELEWAVRASYGSHYSGLLKEHDQGLGTVDKQAYVQQKCEERAYEIGQYARVAAALGQVPTTEEAIFIQAAGLKLEELRVHQPDMPADLVEVLRNRSSIDTKTLEQVSLEQPYLSEKLLGELKRVEPDIETYRDRDNKQKLMIEAGEQALIKAYMDESFIPLQAASQGEHSNDPMAIEIRKHLGALGLLGKSVRELFEYRWEDNRNNKTAT